MNKHENKALQQLVQYAYTQVPYYHRRFDEAGIKPGQVLGEQDLIRLPILTKAEVQQNAESFLSEEYHRYPKINQIELRRTSGSTGQYLRLIWDRKDNIRSLLSLWKLRYHWYGIDPKMKFCSFYTVQYANNKAAQLADETLFAGGRNLAFSKVGLTQERLLACYKRMLEFEPVWFDMQPSVCFLLAQAVKAEGLKPPKGLRYIELNGEMLQKNQREFIESVFGIKPVNMYGMNEVNSIALECGHGKMHVLQDNVIVEVLRDGVPVIGEKGEIYVTCLTNYAMPFIRYRTGDSGTLIEAPCTCGYPTYRLELAAGRSSDYARLANGAKINSYVFNSIVEYTNELMGNSIKQYQVRQQALDCFEVTLALKPAFAGWGDAIAETFRTHINEPGLNDVQWIFKFVPEILPDERTGKLKNFIPMDLEAVQHE